MKVELKGTGCTHTHTCCTYILKVELKGNTGEGTGCTQLIALDPHQLMFGLVQISYTKSLELKIGNRGSVSFDILTIKISSDQEKPVPQYILKNIVEINGNIINLDQKLDSNNCIIYVPKQALTVDPNKNVKITSQFLPNKEDNFKAKLIIQADKVITSVCESEYEIPMSGTGICPKLLKVYPTNLSFLRAGSINFGQVNQGEIKSVILRITNQWFKPIKIIGIRIEPSPPFSYKPNSLPKEFDPQETFYLKISFKTDRVGTFDGILSLETDIKIFNCNTSTKVRVFGFCGIRT